MKHFLFSLGLLLLSLSSFSQALSDDTIHWSNYHKLSWDDFRGEPIEINGFSGQGLMMILSDYKKYSLFTSTRTGVETVFDRKNSWVSSKGKTDKMLKYFQVMFDIYELYARKLKTEYKSTQFGVDPYKVFREKYNAALTALSDRNKLYMKETQMGQNYKEVLKWEKQIGLELKEFEN